MKKWLYFAAACAAAGLLTRLPHPAKDIAKLEPVQVVYLYREDGMLRIETDTGARGAGRDLTEAFQNMRSNADGEIFLETAEFLLLDPHTAVTAEFYALLRPGCRVSYTAPGPDLAAAGEYLSVHPPKTTLRDLRANTAGKEGSQP